MKTRLSQIIAGAIPALFAVSVIFAATAQAEGNRPARTVNVTAMGQSLNAQLRGEAFQFAIESDGRLELTGEGRGVADPHDAVALVRSGDFGGTETSCHIRLGGGVEAALIVAHTPGLPQACALVGEAYDAAV